MVQRTDEITETPEHAVSSLKERIPAISPSIGSESHCLPDPSAEHVFKEKLGAFEKRAEQAVLLMRRSLQNPPTIAELAEDSRVTPWHFIRQFRRTVGIPPGQYLSALRIEEAKKLLLDTSERVTDICFTLGFNSLGSFTSRFTSVVGLSPSAFRNLPDRFSPNLLDRRTEEQEKRLLLWKGPEIQGVIKAPESFSGPIFVGLFPKPISEGFPESCRILAGAGSFRMPLSQGGKFLLVAGICSFDDPSSYLVSGGRILQGIAPVFQVEGGRISEIEIRPPRSLAPPILVALLACLLATSESGVQHKRAR